MTVMMTLAPVSGLVFWLCQRLVTRKALIRGADDGGGNTVLITFSVMLSNREYDNVSSNYHSI